MWSATKKSCSQAFSFKREFFFDRSELNSQGTIELIAKWPNNDVHSGNSRKQAANFHGSDESRDIDDNRGAKNANNFYCEI